MKNILKVFNSTDLNNILIKLSLFFTLMALSLINIIFTFFAFLLIVIYAIFEFNYNSIIWLILYIVSAPYVHMLLILLLLIMFCFIFCVKFILDIIAGNINLKSPLSITLISIYLLLCLLLLIPFAPYYNFKFSLYEILALTILTIVFFNCHKLNIKMLFEIFAIFIAIFCITHNLLGTIGLCNYRYIFISGVNRYSFFLDDPNYTAGIIFIALCCITILNKNNEIKNWLFYSLFIILGVCIFNTISKAGFIVYSLLLAITLIHIIIKIIKSKSKESFIELLLFIASIVVICLISFNSMIATVSRFFNFTNSHPENAMSTLTSERSSIYTIYLSEIFNTPYEAIFGHGTVAPLLEFSVGTGDIRDTHCIALSIMYKYGLLISLLIISLYIIAFLKSKQKINWFNICSAFLILLMYMSLSVIIFSQIYVFFYIFMAAYHNKTSQSEPKTNQLNSAQNI